MSKSTKSTTTLRIEAPKKLTVNLRSNSDGSVDIETGDWSVIRLLTNGKFARFTSISEDDSFQVDKDGRILEDKTAIL